MKIEPPAKNPCGSCPYRRDVPSGVWDEEEYAKLPEYDKLPTAEQPPHVFLCHQQDGRACAGWVAVHDMEESFGLRLATSIGMIDNPEPFLDYETSTPLFESGAEAAEHGLREIDTPGWEAAKVIGKLVKRRG